MTQVCPYDSDKTPPAPALPVRAAAPGESAATLLVALVDTGADITVLPKAVARQLRLPRVGHINVTGFSGSARRVGLYAAQVDAGGASQIVEVVAAGREAIVGRDLLNRWTVTLDGPARVMRL